LRGWQNAVGLCGKKRDCNERHRRSALGWGRHRAASSGRCWFGPYERAFEEISADSRQLLVVAVDEQEIVGTLQLTVIPGLSRRGARRAQIEGVRVSRRYRSRGLGAAMIQWAIRESAARQCVLVQLTSDKSRVDAHRFYERLGFAATHEGFKMSL
jgi:ribosomal protein S18 acetylase RimI-like enzyme